MSEICVPIYTAQTPPYTKSVSPFSAAVAPYAPLCFQPGNYLRYMDETDFSFMDGVNLDFMG